MQKCEQKDGAPRNGDLLFVHEGLPHVMRTLLWEACSYTLDSRTYACNRVCLSTCRFQPPLRAALFEEVDPTDGEDM